MADIGYQQINAFVQCLSSSTMSLDNYTGIVPSGVLLFDIQAGILKLGQDDTWANTPIFIKLSDLQGISAVVENLNTEIQNGIAASNIAWSQLQDVPDLAFGLTLTGATTGNGSVTFSKLASNTLSIATTVTDNSHHHDNTTLDSIDWAKVANRPTVYTQTEINNAFVPINAPEAGQTIYGNYTVQGSLVSLGDITTSGLTASTVTSNTGIFKNLVVQTTGISVTAGGIAVSDGDITNDGQLITTTILVNNGGALHGPMVISNIASSMIPISDATYDLGSSTSRYNNIYAASIVSGGMQSSTASTILTTTTQTALTIGTTSYTSFKLLISAQRGTSIHTSEILAIYDGTSITFVESNIVYNSTILATYDLAVSSTNIQLLISSNSTSSTTFKVAVVAL
jgi:hypothetical protein